MKLQRYVEVSDTPLLTIKCHGDLDINGGREGEVVIKAYGEEDLDVLHEDDQFTITAHARCKVGCPRGTILDLQEVHGDLRIRRVDGPVTAETVHGDCAIKDVGPTTMANVMGDLRVRSANGDLRLDLVGGDLSVRGVEGVLSCGSVGGDLSAVYLKGGLEAAVGGDGSLRTDFMPGCGYVLTTGGDASVKFPTDANASIQITAAGEIHHQVEWAESAKGSGTLSGRVGDGEAVVSITAGGDVSLRNRSDSGAFVAHIALEDAEMDLELESVAEEIERNIEAHMARLHAQLEAKLGRIDHDAIRQKAEKAAANARRKAEHAAERVRLKAERAQRRWERVGTRRPSRPAPGAPPQRGTVEPVTDEERMTVLRMVQEGKITADEAARLLESMGG